MMDEHDWITVKEYADLFRVHVQTVYSAVRSGRLSHPWERVGRTIRIDVSRESIEQRKAS
jgi:excisionase family DNA binding protein